MAGDDQAIDDTRMASRPLPQGFLGPERIHVYDAGAEECRKPAQRSRLRDIVIMPKGMKRLGTHEIGHDHLLTGDQRALDPATGDSRLRARFTDEHARHDEVSSPMATRSSLRNAPTDVAQPMRLSLGVPAKGTHPGPVGPRTLQNPHGLLPDEPPLYPDLRPGNEAELLAKGGRQGGPAPGRDGDEVHSPESIAVSLTRKCIR